LQFPEAPTTRFVAQVGVAVGRADEDALSGVDLQVKSVLQASLAPCLRFCGTGKCRNADIRSAWSQLPSKT